MLNKFEPCIQYLPSDDARLALMKSWANYAGEYNENFEKLTRLLGEFSITAYNNNKNTSFNYAVELEKNIQNHLPKLNEAIIELRSALDKVQGWHITWRHQERGEVIGQSPYSEPQLNDASASSYAIVRAPYEYHLNDGWIVGAKVGVDRTMGGINCWVEISENPNSKRGIYFSISEMFAIEVSPPEEFVSS